MDPLVQQVLARNQAMYDPQRQQAMVEALARRQAVGRSMGALSGGAYGQGMTGGPTPEQMQSQLDEQARQAGYQSYMMERQERADKESARRFDITSGLDMAKILATQQKRATDKTEKQVAAISKGMETLTPVKQAYSDVMALMSRYGEGNIPGVGMFEGGSGALGKTLRLLQGPEAQINYATVENLMGSIRRNAIGSQQTRTELEKIEQRVGQSGWENEAVFRRAIELIGDAIDVEEQNVLARGGDAAVEEYRRRTGAVAPQPTENAVINFEDL